MVKTPDDTSGYAAVAAAIFTVLGYLIRDWQHAKRRRRDRRRDRARRKARK